MPPRRQPSSFEGLKCRQKAPYRGKEVAGSELPATEPARMTLSELYHQGPPATRAAIVPSPAQSAISLSLMEPSFLERLTAPGPRI